MTSLHLSCCSVNSMTQPQSLLIPLQLHLPLGDPPSAMNYAQGDFLRRKECVTQKWVLFFHFAYKKVLTQVWNRSHVVTNFLQSGMNLSINLPWSSQLVCLDTDKRGANTAAKYQLYLHTGLLLPTMWKVLLCHAEKAHS
jgi:hypothetical protein